MNNIIAVTTIQSLSILVFAVIGIIIGLKLMQRKGRMARRKGRDIVHLEIVDIYVMPNGRIEADHTETIEADFTDLSDRMAHMAETQKIT